MCEPLFAEFLWLNLQGTTGADNFQSSVIDSLGNIYSAGYTAGDLEGESNSGGNDMAIQKTFKDGTKIWTKLHGGTGGDLAQQLSLSASDLFIIGYNYSGSLGGQNNNGSYDIAFTKFSFDGVHQWTKLLGGNAFDAGYDVETLNDGTSYITGTTKSDLNGETNNGNSDIFIAKYDNSGNEVWTKLLGGTGNDTARAISLNSDGSSIFITGETASSFGGITNSGGFSDGFISKYDSDGNLAWTKFIGTTGVDYGYGLAINTDDSVLLFGTTNGNLAGLTNNGDYDTYLQKYDSAGNLSWTKLIGGTGTDFSTDIEIDVEGYIYLLGRTNADINGQSHKGGAGDDIFIVKLSPEGNVLETTLYGTTANDTPKDLIIDSDGSIYLTGFTAGDINGETNSGGEMDTFIAKLVMRASSSFKNSWIQPYAAMQSVGLGSIKNNRDLVLAKAGECNNSGWVIENTDYCIYTNANNTIASVNGNSSYGSYDYANFNTLINVEKTINNKWKAGIAYGVGSSNLDNYNFSRTTASLSSKNTHYSIYGVKKVSDKFTLKGMIGGSDFDYKGNRNYSTTSATSTYDTDGYTAEINGTWDIKKTIKNMKTPIRLKPSVGVAYAAHTQDGFSESGSGDLITLEANQAESLLLKTGISVDKQILMEGGKWLLVPSIALNYEMDTYADDDHRGVKGGVTGSSDATTLVSAKTFGQHNGSVKVGADFVLTKDFMFNLNAEYGLAEGGDEQSYGGGFRWQF